MRGLINKENLIEIQYEDLINMPKKTINSLKKFTGVSKFLIKDKSKQFG